MLFRSKEDRYIVEADFIASYPLSTDTPIITPTTPNQTEETPSSQTPTQGERIINTYPIENAIKVSDPSGKADLSAEITEIGILDSVTNEFIATTTLRSSDKIAFKFIISNLGTKKAEGWSFNAVLPTKPFHIFHSNTQATLMTGERIEYAMGFDKAKEGDNEVIIVNVDPNRSIYELNESNNIIKKFIKIIN